MSKPRAGKPPLGLAGIQKWTAGDGWLFKLLAVLAFMTFLSGLPHLIQRVLFPFQVGQGEAINVEFGLTLLRGLSLYHDPSQAPYLYPAYPPLYPWLQSLLMRIIHVIWIPGRLLAFSGYLGCGLAILLWGRNRWGWPPALLLSSLFWLFPTWALWGTMDRCDALYLLMNFSSFLLLYRDDQKETGYRPPRPVRWGVLALAGLFSAAAILLKQTGLSLLAVYGFYCLLTGRWKKISIFLLFCLLPVGTVFWREQAGGDGTFFDHIFLWLDTGVNWENFRYYFMHFFPREGGVLLAAMAFVVGLKKTNVLLILQVGFSLLALLSLARDMGAENYFMDFLLYGIFLAGEGMAFRERDWAGGWFGARGRVPASMVFFLLFLLVYASSATRNWPGLPAPEVIRMKEQAAAEIYSQPGRHLALDMDLPLMAGKRLWIQPAEYSAMVSEGYWSPQPLVNEIREKDYSTIELYQAPQPNPLPPAVMEAIRENYHVKVGKYGRLWLVPGKT